MHYNKKEIGGTLYMMKPLFIYIGLVYAFSAALLVLSKYLVKKGVGEYAKLKEVQDKIDAYSQEIKTLKGEMANIVSRYKELKKSGDGSEDKYAVRDLVTQYAKCKAKLFSATDLLNGCKKKLNEYSMKFLTKNRDKQVEKLNARLDELEKKIATAKKEVESAKSMTECVWNIDIANLIYEMTNNDQDLHVLLECDNINIEVDNLAFSICESVANEYISKDNGNKMLDILPSNSIHINENVPEPIIDIKLKIYEFCMEGKITESERNTLLDSLNK